MSEVANRLRRIAADLEDVAADPQAIGLVESIIGIFGREWWERQNDRRLAVWYERAQAYLSLRAANDE